MEPGEEALAGAVVREVGLPLLVAKDQGGPSAGPLFLCKVLHQLPGD